MLGFAGRWWWPFDVMSSFRLHYAMVLVASSLALLVLGRRGAAAAAALLFVVNAVLVVPLWFGRAPADDGAVLRVLSHNIHGGGAPRHADVVAALPSSRADLAFFSQASRQLASAVTQAAVGHRVIFPASPDEHARVIVSGSRDVGRSQRVSLGSSSPSSAVAVEVELDGRTLHVLGVHTRSPRSPSRAAVRDRELAHVAAWVRSHEGPVLVIGDLNVTPWSHAFRDLLSETGLRDSQRGFGVQPTWPAGSGLLMIPIDHALHSPELAVVRRTTGPALGSAHRSLTVEIGWAVPDDA